MLIFLLIVNILFTFKSVRLSQTSGTKCVFYSHSDEEYLYAGMIILTANFKRPLFTYSLGSIFSSKNANTFDLEKDDRKGVWILESIANRQNVFFIKNLYYQEYMCASEPTFTFFSKSNSRYVNTVKRKNETDETFMWRFERSNRHPQSNKFNIYSLKYNYLLAASKFTQKGGIRREVRLVNATNLIYLWDINCKNNSIFEN